MRDARNGRSFHLWQTILACSTRLRSSISGILCVKTYFVVTKLKQSYVEKQGYCEMPGMCQQKLQY